MTTTKLAALRSVMKKHNLTSLILPKNNAFFYSGLPEEEDHAFILTKFTGSNLTTLITQEKALLITDSRYTI